MFRGNLIHELVSWLGSVAIFAEIQASAVFKGVKLQERRLSTEHMTFANVQHEYPLERLHNATFTNILR